MNEQLDPHSPCQVLRKGKPSLSVCRFGFGFGLSLCTHVRIHQLQLITHIFPSCRVPKFDRDSKFESNRTSHVGIRGPRVSRRSYLEVIARCPPVELELNSSSMETRIHACSCLHVKKSQMHPLRAFKASTPPALHLIRICTLTLMDGAEPPPASCLSELRIRISGKSAPRSFVHLDGAGSMKARLCSPDSD